MRFFSESGEASEHRDVNGETGRSMIGSGGEYGPPTEYSTTLDWLQLASDSPKSSTLEDITERLHSIAESRRASISEIDDLEESVSQLPPSEAADRLRDIVRDWETRAKESVDNTLHLKAPEIAEALKVTEAVMTETGSLDADCLADFQRRATRVVGAFKFFSDIAGNETIPTSANIALPGSGEVIRLILWGLKSLR